MPLANKFSVNILMLSIGIKYAKHGLIVDIHTM